jgi:hypothetical protein
MGPAADFSRWRKLPPAMLILAIALQLAVLFFHQVTTIFDLFPFNGARFSARRERFLEAGFNGALMAPGPLGFILGISSLMRFGTAFYFILFVGELATWWVPYFFGASPKWAEIYARVQGRTITIVPRRGANPAPNLEHLILMALTLATALATLAAYRSLAGASLRGWWVAALVALGVGLVVVYQCCLMGRKKPGTPAA